MKRTAFCLALLFVASCALGAASDNPAAHFDQLKKLAGSWEGKTLKGEPVTITLRVVSAGSALMQVDENEGMVSMIHPDNGRLLLTHYCAAGNQPRMHAEVSPDGKRFNFNFLDATNVPTPATGHMRRMVLTIDDENHISEQWFFRTGSEEKIETFKFARK